MSTCEGDESLQLSAAAISLQTCCLTPFNPTFFACQKEHFHYAPLPCVKASAPIFFFCPITSLRCRETRQQQSGCLLNGNLFPASTLITMRLFIRCAPHLNIDWKMIFKPESAKVTSIRAMWSAVIFSAELWNVGFPLLFVLVGRFAPMIHQNSAPLSGFRSFLVLCVV